MSENGEQHGVMRTYREVLKRFITNGGIVAVTHQVRTNSPVSRQ